MTRARTVGEKRRLKKLARDMPKLAEVPKRDKSGCFAERTRQQGDKEPDRVALEARARHMGMDGSKAERRRAMRTVMLGEAAGRAIYLVYGDSPRAAALWRVYADMTAAEDRYARMVLGRSLHAKTSKVEFAPDRFEARADDRPDLRSEDEKIRAVVSSWMRWRGHIGCLESGQQSALFAVVRGRVEPVNCGIITTSGKAFLSALNTLEKFTSGRVER